jgi:23S rRNA (pseudouridine1915-N3)-methyltransferase
MTVFVVAVGRVKSPFLRDACETFTARIRRYLKLEVREVRDAGRRERDALLARRLETTSVLQTIPDNTRIIALTRCGRSLSSEEFATQLERWQRDPRDVALVVGGAHGFDNTLLERADDRLSLSPMTLPHDVARLVLLEQLYRACTILRGEPYHKGAAT